MGGFSKMFEIIDDIGLDNLIIIIENVSDKEIACQENSSGVEMDNGNETIEEPVIALSDIERLKKEIEENMANVGNL